MYVCVYVCVYVCMYVCMYVCVYVYMYACMHVCMYACMHVCMYVCMCVCVCPPTTGQRDQTPNRSNICRYNPKERAASQIGTPNQWICSMMHIYVDLPLDLSPGLQTDPIGGPLNPTGIRGSRPTNHQKPSKTTKNHENHATP